ncbi:MAG: hypothetical protein P8H91_04050 [Flavobacteriaceae bacterium]|jgi:uncharacterized membrane protein|nr:hypothetical protein [Flavobacteriaceae bacterium]MDG2289956.1 hypothetical protein [Flavobacteriaceae bacterium]
MIKFYRISEIIYLVFGGLFLFRAINYYGTEDARTAIDLAITGVAVFMYFIRRRYRKKLEQRKDQ